MENNKQYAIVLDGKMDESVWDTVPEHGDFLSPRILGGKSYTEQTSFKVLPLGDKLYVGIKCLVNENMERLVAEARNSTKTFLTSSVEMFFSPSGTGFEYYQFMVSMSGATDCNYYSEGGFIKPDPYAPQWSAATYIGDDYWSVEAEIPLTAFYWTSHTAWSTKWLMNVARIHPVPGKGADISAWSLLDATFMEPTNFRSLEGFPVRPVKDDICMISAMVDLAEETENGYRGIMRVETKNAVAGEFIFVSNLSQEEKIILQEGNNVITVPCAVDSLGVATASLCLTRCNDGKKFQRSYPLFVEFEPIKLHFTLPEYRNNFYPGQDYSRIVGTAKSFKDITLKLEGPGIETQTITPNADGSFVFETPNFQEGDAYITATIDGYETKKKIRRLAPTGHTMAWISGGNLIVDGKPVLRRDMYAPFYKGGEALNKKFREENFYLTNTDKDHVDAQPHWMVPGSESAGGEAVIDGDISDVTRAAVDQRIADNKDKDYVYYYISDEPECRGLSRIYLRNLYNYIAEKDPYHVVLTASRRASQFVDCADWFETHPYINPSVREDGSRAYERPINMIGSFVEDITKLNRPDKCIGFLPSCFAYKWTSDLADYPTFDEMICHTWAAMMRGGKSLWPYAYHDMNDRASVYEGMRYVFATFEALEELVLLGKRTTLYRTPEAEAVLYDTGDEQMFVLANLTGKPQKVVLENLSGTWHYFRHNGMITGNTFELKPFEVVEGTSALRGGDLPTYQEIADLIDKTETERLANQSLLFNRQGELSYTTSADTQFFYKLFDGTKDNMAWMHASEREDKFFELNLTKVKPTFQKLIIGGYGLENMKLLVRNGDELAEPVVAQTSTEEYAKTYVFEKPICPDALRMEFTCQLAELYEVEVF